MTKEKRLSVRLAPELNHAIEELCEESNCSRTEAVEALIRRGLEGDIDLADSVKSEASNTKGPQLPSAHANAKPISKGWISEIRHDNGCIDRYDKDGKFKMHLRPDPNSKGRYLDLQNNRWYKNGSGQWVGIVTID